MQIASRKLLWKDGSIPKDKTVLFLNVTPESMTACIATCAPAVGSESIVIDWGDGTQNEYTHVSNATHTYSRDGEYMVTISDDVSSFGYVSYNTDIRYRDMILELANLAPKVTSIEGYGFNNCHKMRGVMNLPSVNYIGGYAFGTTLGITDFILPSMRSLVQTSFYAGPSPAQMHVDNVERIDRSFFGYYNKNRLKDMYIANRTRDYVKRMSGFPFEATADTRFHCQDGILLGNGTYV